MPPDPTTTSAEPRPASGNAAIYFHPDAYVVDRRDLKGRHVGGDGFLRGFFAHAEIDTVYAYAEGSEHARVFEEIVAADPALARRGLPHATLGPASRARLAEAGALHFPGPELDRLAWVRRRVDQRAYSVTGVTHTIASHKVMTTVCSFLTAPVQAWDALVCSSTVARRVVERLLDEQEAYLRERIGAAGPITRPQLPVIPFGVDPARFAPPGGPEAEGLRRGCRERLGIGPGDLVVLFAGRLSYHAKAHPLPMLLGLEQAARSLPARSPAVHLIQAGRYPNDATRQIFEEAQAALAPSVRHHRLDDARDPEAWSGVWQAADVFCSLADSVQETFGLTPVEAMAAGLPVVASDWDGYRDTVEHGATGILVPTTLMPAEAGAEVGEFYADERLSYDRYLLETGMLAAVDVAGTRDAFRALLGDPERRTAMGAAGRRRVAELYDWRVVIAGYQAMWAELAARRGRDAEMAVLRPVPDGSPRLADPSRPNPLELFASFPSRQLAGGTRLVRSRLAAEAVRKIAKLRVMNIEGSLVRPSPLAGEIMERVARVGHGLTLDTLLASVPAERRQAALRAVAWLVKAGALEVRPG